MPGLKQIKRIAAPKKTAPKFPNLTYELFELKSDVIIVGIPIIPSEIKNKNAINGGKNEH